LEQQRGGLIVPATTFEFSGLVPYFFPNGSQGADEEDENRKLLCLCTKGFEFSNSANDSEAKEAERKISFLVNDAPALANSEPTLGTVTDLQKLRGILEWEGADFIPLPCR
jgi:hypothetical protein